MMPERNSLRDRARSLVDRVTATIDRLYICGGCGHEIDTPGCLCDRSDCACTAGDR